MKLQILLLAFLLVLPFTFGVTVSINFASPTHNFKGVGWNVNSTSFQWTDSELRPLLDSTHMQFARVLGWSPSWYAPSETQRTYEATDMQGLYGFLQYAKDKNITIQLANWDTGGKFLNSSVSGTNYWTCQTTALWPVTNCWPDQYFWLSEISHNDPTNLQNRFCHRMYAGDPGTCSNSDKTSRNSTKGVESDHPYSADIFSRVLADSLDYIVNTKGFNNIQFISLWNEPNGDWAYHPRDQTKKYPASFRELYSQMKAKLNSNPSLSSIKLIGFDGSFNQAEFQNIQNNIDAIGIHDYTTGPQQVISAKASTTKPIIIGEAGDQTRDLSCGAESSGIPWENLSVERKKAKVLQNSIISTKNIFSDIREGAYAAARWWYNGSTGCFVATLGRGVAVNDITKYNFNSVKILSESIPQANYDFRVLALTVSSGSQLNAVAIDYARVGEPQKIAIWVVNPDSQPITFSIPGTGLSSIKSLKKSQFDNSTGDIIYIPDQIPFSSTQPIAETIAPNSIMVFTEYNAIPLTAENCSNNIDDDGDGKIDCTDTDCTNNSTPQPGGTCCSSGQKIQSNTIIPGDSSNRLLCYNGQIFSHWHYKDQPNNPDLAENGGWAQNVPQCTIKGNYYAKPQLPNDEWNGGWSAGTGNGVLCGAGKKCNIQRQCIIVPTSACPDAKKDGTINILDLVAMAKAINQKDLAYNLNADTATDIVDLRIAADEIGTNC
ncbi:MAG: hypothetical protein Q7R70_01575 [Candidatus Diapherotrites archaeon]|nr:hypothetical protein [Candidatus Diapherotrites archaeon]